MTFGYESVLLSLDYSTLKTGLDLVMCIIAVVLFGLFMRVQTGKSAAWFDILEKLIGLGFVGAATAAVFLLPLTKEAVIIYLVWYYFQAALYHFLPGKTYNGLELAEQRADGRKILPYKCNGLLAFIITMISYFGGGYLGLFKLSILWDNFLPLLNAVNIFSFATTFYLMLRGVFSKDGKPNRVSTGNPVEDFWYGLELNPRGVWGGLETGFFDFDIKFFSESRPGLILWVLINFSIAASQYEQLGYITTPMILVCAFHFIYVCDYFVVEEYIVSTIDIIHERFGWMLVWGDYAWVPFFYVQQAIYLYFLPRQHSTTYNVINVLVFLLGYAVFRGSNRQKHKYKENPKGNIWFKKAVTLKDKFPEAKRGGHLLISGWWGLARHINYLGDLILAFSWGMTCHFESYMPYLYLVFMTGLLLHRFARDDKKCAAKYGEDWDRYCKAVPYKLIPYVW